VSCRLTDVYFNELAGLTGGLSVLTHCIIAKFSTRDRIALGSDGLSAQAYSPRRRGVITLQNTITALAPGVHQSRVVPP
jgi:hypothetical protein